MPEQNLPSESVLFNATSGKVPEEHLQVPHVSPWSFVLSVHTMPAKLLLYICPPRSLSFAPRSLLPKALRAQMGAGQCCLQNLTSGWVQDRISLSLLHPTALPWGPLGVGTSTSAPYLLSSRLTQPARGPTPPLDVGKFSQIPQVQNKLLPCTLTRKIALQPVPATIPLSQEQLHSAGGFAPSPAGRRDPFVSRPGCELPRVLPSKRPQHLTFLTSTTNPPLLA